ncbi:DNA repair protein Rad26 [Aspergillus sclerotiicarbonarius CBS 121057]|uniref:DNA repair protein Rad26 n=1 Tax=Aspergillus sclerotiicarbonarius (strain CBS 121057 / IBT 28362) TaxID=1448318 RepID=A0A319FCZ5_ASPSB|nr:DNA repair protein Rad26 [Aspergillus sclerotiicarbonarius CBS 121057]
MEDNDDDFFSDDGFDDIPPSTLFQLEQNAYHATQVQIPQQQHQQPVTDSAKTSRTFSDLNLDAVAANATLHTGLSNDYDVWDIGELDAEVLDDGVPIQSNAALDQAATFAASVHHPQHDTSAGDDDYGDLPDPMEIEEEGTSRFPELHKAYAELSEKLALETARHQHIAEELAAAKSMAETKTGEIAIIRANQAKLAANYDRQLAALRKAMEDEAARHEEEVAAARAEGKMFATENAFLRQDLAEESMRANQLKEKGRAEEKAPPTTPKKAKVLPFRDGFDDDEILAVSPSKLARSKRTTPVVPGKRKRKASQDSPTPLQFSPQLEPIPLENAEDLSDDTMLDAVPDQAQPVEVPRTMDPSIIKRLMNHRTSPDGKPDIEIMAGLAFPSEPQRMLSTILLETTESFDLGNYMVEYARAIISLWSRALAEKYFQPIPMFISIMRYLVSEDLQAFDKDLYQHLVPVLQVSAEVNAVPRFHNSPVSRPNLGRARKTPLSELEPLVDSTEVLGLLYDMACIRFHVERDMIELWRPVRYDFVLTMLNCSQPIDDIVLMLSLLSTSIRTDSFGPVQESEEVQNTIENYIVDRVANLLSEQLLLDEGQEPYMAHEICSMRQEALAFLTSVAFNARVPGSTHGSMILASHPTVLARLIRVAHDELDALYALPPEKNLHAALVNGLICLIHGVIGRHREQADLQPKLCRVPGGKQKFLVVLTRLAFSEGLVLEAGIDDDTVEMAHSILDDAVTPQEAEALYEAFPNAKRDEEDEEEKSGEA